MTKQTINVGSGEYAGDGESLRSALVKTNDNFTEVYQNINIINAAGYLTSSTLSAYLPYDNDAGYLTSSTVNQYVNNFTVTNISYFTNDVKYLTSSTVNQYVNNFTVTNISYFTNDVEYLTTATLPPYPTANLGHFTITNSTIQATNPDEYLEIHGYSPAEGDGKTAEFFGGDAGSSTGGSHSGGDARIFAGRGVNGGMPGKVSLRVWNTLSNRLDWDFTSDGMLTFPGTQTISDADGDLVITNPVLRAGVSIGVHNPNEDPTHWYFASNGQLNLPSGAGFARGDSGQLKVNDAGTLSLDIRDNYGRGFYTNSDGFSLRGNGSNTWKFGTDGKLTFPNNSAFDGQTLTDHATSVNYTLKIANGGVAGSKFAIGTGSAAFGIANDALNHAEDGYVPYSVTAQRINLTVLGAGSWVFDNNGNLTVPGDIKSQAGIGPVVIEANDGTARTWTFGGNGNITFPNNTVQTTAWNDAAFMASMLTYDGAIVTNTATIGAGGLTVNGPVVFNGPFTFESTATTAVTGNTGTFFGDVTGVGALYAGVAGYTPLPATVFQSSANVNDYIQNNFQNLDHGVTASTEWVATNDTGNDTNNYIDMGIAGHGWNGSQANSVGTAAGPSDSWVYVQGTTTSNEGGNLILGTIKDGKAVKILAGSTGSNSIVAQFSSLGLRLNKGSLTFSDSTVQTTAWTGTVAYSNITGTPASFNTSTLVAQAVTALSIPYANVSGTPNLTIYATTSQVSSLPTTATVVALIASSLTNYVKIGTTATFIGTGTASSTNTGILQVQGGAGISGNLYANTIYSGDGYFRGPSGYGNISLASGGSVYISEAVINGTGLIKGPGGSTHIALLTGTGGSVKFYNTATIAGTTSATSTTTGALTVAGGVGISGDVYANKFVGDGSNLTNITLSQAGNIIGTQSNVTLVAGGYSYLFSNTGTFTMPVDGDIVMTGINSILSAGGTTLLGGATQAVGSYSTLGVSYPGAGTQFGMTLRPVADNTTAIQFLNAAGTNIGSITQTTSTVKFTGDGSGLTNLAGVATKTTGNWTLATGANTVNFSVPGPGTYNLWVNGNVPNGIVTYTANVVVTNQNVPVLGTSYGWYYAAGNALVLTAIPNQIVGTANNISSAVVATSTAWTFTFGITNNSTSSQTVSYGYTRLG